MNTTDKWLITGKFLDDKRRARWEDIFPDGIIPIKSAVVQNVSLEILGDRPCVFLDVGALSPELCSRIRERLAEIFDVSIDAVPLVADMEVPIIVKDMLIEVR